MGGSIEAAVDEQGTAMVVTVPLRNI
jgi:hypothetical protein